MLRKSGSALIVILILAQVMMPPAQTMFSQEITENIIPVGNNPTSLAVNPYTNRIYVTNYADNTVSVINGKTDTVIATIPVGEAPYGIDVNPATNKIYVANGNYGAPLSVIDGNTNTVVKQIPVTQNARGVAVNPITNKIYVTVHYNDIVGSPYVEVIDGNTDAIAATVPTINSCHYPSGVEVNPKTNLVYVRDNDCLAIIDGDTNTIIDHLPIGVTSNSSLGIDVNPKTNRVYETNNYWTGPLYIVDGTTSELMASLSVPPADSYPMDLAVNTTTNHIFIASYRGTVTVLDGNNNTFIADPLVIGGKLTGSAANPFTNKVYFTDSEGGRVIVLEDGPQIPCNQTSDMDGDALLDGWEVCGYDHNADGVIDVDLPNLGADPHIKDIFVEVDYMVDHGICVGEICFGGGHTHKPDADAIAPVVETFNTQAGIHLHVDFGAEAPLTWGYAETWGNYSHSNELEHQDTINADIQSWDDPNDWPAFDEIKLNQGNFFPERIPIFHYVVFAHLLGGTLGGNPLGTTSGLSRGRPSSDFIVSLGGFANEVGTSLKQAATFMHELGHNLGLRDGGDDDQIFEPNYLSVMSYAYQMDGLIQINPDGSYQMGIINYSSFGNIVPELDETNLNETIGMGDSPPFNVYGIRYFCRSENEWSDQISTTPNDPIDWNCDDAYQESVIANINDGYEVSPDSTLTILTGAHDDWGNLVFSGGLLGQKSLIALPASAEWLISDWQGTVTGELTAEVANSLYKPYAVAIGPSYRLIAAQDTNVSVPLTITNTGALISTISLSAALETTWIDASSLPETVILESGESIVFPVGIRVTSTAITGEVQEITLYAEVEGAPLMGDAVNLNVQVGPMAWFKADSVSGTIPHLVNFSDLSIGEIYSWHWDFGDGMTSDFQNPGHIYTRAGMYTVSLTVTGDYGSHSSTQAAMVRVISNKNYLPMIRK